MPSVIYFSDMRVEEGAGYGNCLPLWGAIWSAKLALGIEGIFMSLKVSLPRVKARVGTPFCVEDWGRGDREGD